MRIVFHGGPSHGKVYETPGDQLQPLVYAAVPEPVELWEFGREEPWSVPTFHRAEYQPRRWPRCGRPVYTDMGDAIYDYVGTY